MSGASSNGSSVASAVQLSRLLQFGDSMFPVGGFSFSGGLESAVEKGVVVDLESLEAFTRTAIEQAALGDGIALVWAHRAALEKDLDALVAIDQRVYARKLSAETRTMTVRMGKKLTETGAGITATPFQRTWLEQIEAANTPGCYPVGLAINFATLGQSARDAFVVHQYGVAAMVLGAAMRLMRVSHIDTQRLLYELSAAIDDDWETASRASLADMAGFAPEVDILAAVHVKAHVRLFMN